MRLKTLPSCIALLCTASLSFNVSADDSAIKQFNIPAQSLQSALNQFSETADMQMSYPATLAEGVTSQGISGQYTSEQALQKLLDGSGLEPQVINNTVTIKLPKASSLTTEGLLVAAGTENYLATDATNTSSAITPVEQEDLTVSGHKLSGYNVLNASTATRTDTAIMELPQSIQVVPRSVIDDQQNITVSESLRNVSGVVARNPLISPNFEPTLMRGFSSMQMVDGFYQNLNTGDQGSLVNIQQIEVLKGANATLYSGGGGSPVGGVVNMVSKLPEKEAFYEFGIKGGSYAFYQPYIDINQPINDNVLFRITTEYTNSGSHIDTLKTERYNINPSITLTDNEATNFTIQGKYSNWEQQDYQGLPATGTVTGDFKIDPKLYAGPDDMNDSTSEYYAVWATLDHQINSVWSATSKFRYAHSEHDTFVQSLVGADGFGAAVPFMAPSTWGLMNAELYQKQTEMDFQAYVTANFDLGVTQNTVVIGGDFSQQEEEGFMDVDMMGSGFVDLTNPSFPAYTFGARQNNQFTTSTTYGGYVQLQSTIYDRLHLITGFRVGHISTKFQNTDPFFGFNADSDKTRFLPNVGAVFDVTDQFSLFFNYNEGMRAQTGVNFVTAPSPELSTQMETGIKFNIADQLSGQLAFFQVDRKDVAVTDFNDPLFRSVAAGKQQSQGVETNMTWQATEGLSFLANYAFTEAKFKDSLAGVTEGNLLPGVPKHAGRFWANYAFQYPMLRGLSIGSGVYAQSSSYLGNANVYKAPSYFTMDASVAYQIKQYNFGLSIKNLTNENDFQRLNYFGNRTTPMQGTSVFFNASAKF